MSGVDDRLAETVDEIRAVAHELGARRLVATMPTLDGEVDVDYRPGDWLRVTIRGGRERSFVLPPDWRGP